MSTLVREGFIYKKLLVGLLATGCTGVAIFYGYSKWKSRPRSIPGKDGTPVITPGENARTQSKEDSTLTKDSPKDIKSDPTPVLQPEHNISRNADASHSPSDGKLTDPDPQNKDAPIITTETNSRDGIQQLVSPAGGRTVVQDTSDPSQRSRTEMQVDLPGAVKPGPTTAKSSISVANMPKSVSQSSSSATPSTTKTQPQSSDDDDEEDEDDDDDDDESGDDDDSEESDDSQAKRD